MKKFILFVFLAILSGTAGAQPTVGLIQKNPASLDGYVLFPPMFSDTTYLIDKCGKKIHSWQSSYDPALSSYLTPEGLLLRPANVHNTLFTRGGNGGLLEELDWNSNVVWSYKLSDSMTCLHHDVCRLPNGNILAIAWEAKTYSEALGEGRDPRLLSNGLWPDKIIELQPNGTNSATIVWEWHAWDHLVQDFNSGLPNYGVVADHPELLNLNWTDGNATDQDWLHVNSVAYNPYLDQIVLSSYYFNEIWIIDHSTTTLEASTHTGGNSGRGGDILYRWGNPQTYNQGNSNDQRYFRQHDAHWIASNAPDSGRIIVFNNGDKRPQGDYSTVEIITPPIDNTGAYTWNNNSAYGPVIPTWMYKAPNPSDFFSGLISGADRLPNGNTLICNGVSGNFFEVDSIGNTVWKYINPVSNSGISTQGHAPGQNSVFHIRQYQADYPGFNNQSLTPLAPIEINPLPSPCDSSSTLSIGNVRINEQQFLAVNPFENNIVLKCNQDEKGVKIYLLNELGSLCGQWNPDFSSGKWNTLHTGTDLSAGNYFLRIISSTGTIIIKLNKEQ